MRYSSVFFLLLWTAVGQCTDVVSVEFRDAEQTRKLTGQLLVTAADGGVLIETTDGRTWSITPEMLIKQSKIENANFKPLDAKQLGEVLLADAQSKLPNVEFEIVTTKHYVICTSAGPRYAQWCGALFERLMRSFQTHWKANKVELHEPTRPLPAIVLSDREQFAQFANKDEGPSAAASQGYYSIRSNRIVIFDLTATPGSQPAKTTAEINRKVAASPFNVATVVHEATHQIAFNCGMHTRMADNPLWVTEGMAMYFETPDLRSRNGWRTVGKPNRLRLNHFADAIRNERRKPGNITAIVSSDKTFQDVKIATDSYAESWALTYFLIKTRRADYKRYLDNIQAKPRLIWDNSETRLKDFQAAFGDDLEQLEKEFLRYMRRLSR